MRTETLGPFTAGIDRTLVKGGPEKTVLYDLLNGYIDISGRAVSRPGSSQETSTLAGTKGLAVFGGKFVVFASSVVAMADSRFVCAVLVHPTDSTKTVAKIHYADAIAGALYVAAEFDNGDIFHYWLNPADTWAASHDYQVGDLVQPAVENGFVYRAARFDAPAPSWAPKVTRALNDYVEPTTYNGFKYKATEVDGANPRSGDTEPTWPTSDGATVYEDTNIPTIAPGGTTTDPGDAPGSGTTDRYGSGTGANRSGGGHTERQ